MENLSTPIPVFSYAAEAWPTPNLYLYMPYININLLYECKNKVSSGIFASNGRRCVAVSGGRSRDQLRS